MKLYKFSSLIPFKWGSHDFQELPESFTISIIIVGTQEVHYYQELLEEVSGWEGAWKKLLGCLSSPR